MTKTFEICLKEHIRRYPKAQPQDIYKLCFQAAFGAEHLLQDEERAWQYLQREYENLPPTAEGLTAEEQPLLERIAPEVVRVHLSVYKAKGLSLETLFGNFVKSAREFAGDEQKLTAYLDVATKMIANGEMIFAKEEWDLFCKDREIAPVHHSDVFREAYKPSYRVLAGKYILNLGSDL